MNPKQKNSDGRRLRKADDANPAILKGKFFHSLEDGHMKWQGHILAMPRPGYYLVQLFEWLMGEPSIQVIVPFEKMHDWFFYDSAEDMDFSYQHGSARHFRKRIEDDDDDEVVKHEKKPAEHAAKEAK